MYRLFINTDICKKIIFVAMCLFIALTTTQCKKSTGPSTVSFISGQDPQSCQQMDQARVAQVTASMSGLFVGWNDQSDLNLAMNLVAALPDAYLNHLVKSQSNGFAISLKSEITRCGTNQDGNYKGIAGCTSIAYMPTFADVLQGQTAHALIHELGHGLRTYVAQSGGTGDFMGAFTSAYELEALPKDAQGNYTNTFVGSYAKGNIEEYFAEAFQSFYCSPATNSEMKAQLPSTYDVLQKSLLPPHWGGSGGATGSLANATPSQQNNGINPGIPGVTPQFGGFGTPGYEYSCGIQYGGFNPLLAAQMAKQQAQDPRQCGELLKLVVLPKQVTASNSMLTLNSAIINNFSTVGMTICLGDAAVCSNPQTNAPRFRATKVTQSVGNYFSTAEIPAATMKALNDKINQTDKGVFPLVTVEGTVLNPESNGKQIPFRCESGMRLNASSL